MKLMLYHRHSLLYYYSILYLKRIKEGNEGCRDELLSRFSEFRVGCPYTRVFTGNQIREMLWFFEKIKIEVQYCVYDTNLHRKLRVDDIFNVVHTRDPEIDRFFDRFNRAVKDREDLRQYGWHLLVEAIK